MDHVRANNAEGIVSPQTCSQQPVSAEETSATKRLRSRIRSFFARGIQERAGKSSRPPVARHGAALLAGFLVVGVVMTGCSGNAGGAAATRKAYTGDTVTFATSAVPPSLNPAIGDPSYATLYHWAYDPLVVMNGDGTFSPGLAEKFGYVGEGNRTYELTLREGLKFSDGTVLNAAALKKNLDYSRGLTLGTATILLAAVENVEVTGPLTVRLTLSRPDPGLSFYFAQAFGAGYPISPDSLDKPATLDAATAGAGPYMLNPAETVAGDHYTFVKNPNYWNPERQHFKSVTVRVIANPSSTIQAAGCRQSSRSSKRCYPQIQASQRSNRS